MLLSQRLKAVWCETLDDVTLIWNHEESEVVEFVQVKADRLDQLWSSAKLYAREKKKDGSPRPGSSVLEKLLANDRCEEPCCFRMVTRRPVVDELRVLEAELGAAARSQGSERMQTLCKTLDERLDGAASPNGHGPTWWAEHTLWEAGHSEESLRNRNLHLLAKAVETTGRFLASDQREQLYELLLMKVKTAADADKALNRDAGKLASPSFADWFAEQVLELERGGSQAGGRNLRRKLEVAGIPADTVDSAEELRRAYLSKWLRPSYLDRDVSREWEATVRAELIELRSRLDSGQICEDGIKFHDRTLRVLERLRSETAPGKALSKHFVQGCMYYIVDLCQHRFLRAKI
jgi:hypothetical protein